MGFESLTKTVAVKEQIIINNENSAKYTTHDSNEADRSLLKKRKKKKEKTTQTQANNSTICEWIRYSAQISDRIPHELYSTAYFECNMKQKRTLYAT